MFRMGSKPLFVGRRVSYVTTSTSPSIERPGLKVQIKSLRFARNFRLVASSSLLLSRDDRTRHPQHPSLHSSLFRKRRFSHDAGCRSRRNPIATVSAASSIQRKFHKRNKERVFCCLGDKDEVKDVQDLDWASVKMKAFFAVTRIQKKNYGPPRSTVPDKYRRRISSLLYFTADTSRISKRGLQH